MFIIFVLSACNLNKSEDKMVFHQDFKYNNFFDFTISLLTKQNPFILNEFTFQNFLICNVKNNQCDTISLSKKISIPPIMFKDTTTIKNLFMFKDINGDKKLELLLQYQLQNSNNIDVIFHFDPINCKATSYKDTLNNIFIAVNPEFNNTDTFYTYRYVYFENPKKNEVPVEQNFYYVDSKNLQIIDLKLIKKNY